MGVMYQNDGEDERPKRVRHPATVKSGGCGAGPLLDQHVGSDVGAKLVKEGRWCPFNLFIYTYA